MMEQEKSMEQELLTCPWCEKTPIRGQITHGEEFRFAVSCENPSCRVSPMTDGFLTAQEATTAWNIRTTDAKDAAIAALKGTTEVTIQQLERDDSLYEAQAEQIRVLREALEECNEVACDATCDRVSQPTPIHTRECRIARAALASTAPVAEKKEGEQ